MAFLGEKYPDVAKKIKEIQMENKSDDIGIAETSQGQKVLYKMHQGRKWFLNSRLDPQAAAEIYSRRYDIRLYGVYFIFGFSDGRCVRELLKKSDDTNLLIICEPDLKQFALACHNFDLTELMKDERLLIYFPEVQKNIDFILQQLVEYTRIKLLEFCILPGYDIIYHMECEKFMDNVLERMQYATVNKATHETFNRSISQHRLYHMKNMLRYSNIEQLKEKLSVYDLTDIPVIIVSAGPSLDKNIHFLKKSQGKAVIIAVDASVRTVLQAGVCPDMLCSVDPRSPERFFTDLDLSDIYWFCNQSSNPILIEKYARHIFYYGDYGKMWEDSLKDALGYWLPGINSGGSVSTEAYMLALYLGFRKIVLIGQDLAFTGGISHTKGARVESNEKYIKKRHIVEVEGIDGTILQTDFQMWFYKQWFEKAIRMNKDVVRVIDATEGGAKIEGTEISTLEEVIATECIQNFDMHQIEEHIPTMFSEEQKKKLEKKLQEMRKGTVTFLKDVEKVIEEQEKVLLETERDNGKSVQIIEQLRKLTELNKVLQDSPVLEYISGYAYTEEYEIGDTIYAEENLTPEQLIEKSLALLKGYQKGAKLFLEDFDEIIMKDE